MTPEEVRIKCIEYALRLAEKNEEHPTLEKILKDAKKLEGYAWKGEI